MIIGTLQEILKSESRVAMTPASAVELQKLGHICILQSGAGVAAGYTDESYSAVGVSIENSADEIFRKADVIAKVRPPTEAEFGFLATGKTLISFFYPGQEEALLSNVASTGANVGF